MTIKQTKIHRLCGIDSAIELLRPGAKWEICNRTFTKWDDPRPCPSWEEIDETIKKAEQFEDSIDVIWRQDQIKELTGRDTLGDS